MDCQVIASSSRVENIVNDGSEIDMLLTGPLGIPGISRLRFAKKPSKIQIKENAQDGYQDIRFVWDQESQTALVRYENKHDGINMKISP